MSKNKINVRNILLMVAITLTVMVMFIFSTYGILKISTINMVKSYTDELAIHDMATIKLFVNDKWDSMNNIANEFHERNFTGINNVMEELELTAQGKEFDYVYLLDDNGTLYSGTGNIYDIYHNPILEFFNSEGDEPFAVKYGGKGFLVEVEEEYMLYGTKLNSSNALSVNDNGQDVNFVGIAVLNDISKIRQRLRITCFDEKGYTSIIDGKGDYIIPEDNSGSPTTYKNFYDLLSERQIDKTDVETIKEKISNEENVSFWCTTPEGARRFVSVYIIEDSEWDFVIALGEGIFTEQINSFLMIVLIIFAILLLGMSVILFIINRMRRSLKKMYSSVTENVFNRQFYEDKLKDMHVFTLAIMDLDKLKTINDTYGHVAGDQAIDRVASVIASYVGHKGLVCRYGGDEFIVAFNKNLSSQEFKNILEEIRKNIEISTFEDYPELKISMSIGGNYTDGKVDDLLKQTDEYLYKAKETRNRVIVNFD